MLLKIGTLSEINMNFVIGVSVPPLQIKFVDNL